MSTAESSGVATATTSHLQQQQTFTSSSENVARGRGRGGNRRPYRPRGRGGPNAGENRIQGNQGPPHSSSSSRNNLTTDRGGVENGGPSNASGGRSERTVNSNNQRYPGRGGPNRGRFNSDRGGRGMNVPRGSFAQRGRGSMQNTRGSVPQSHFNVNAAPFVPPSLGQQPPPFELPSILHQQFGSVPPLMSQQLPLIAGDQPVTEARPLRGRGERGRFPNAPKRGNRKEGGQGQNEGAGRGRPQQTRIQRKRRDTDYDEKLLKDRLTRQLEDNAYECMICCHTIHARQGIWTCKQCYHMFHISGNCITEWARKSREEDGKWRCPACNGTNDKIPYNYYCFCGTERNPAFNKTEIPHSCGNTCGGTRGIGCVHKCTDICHPGPCPECPVQLIKRCNCGKVEKAIRCGTGLTVKCDNVCEKTLNCGVHKCEAVCHDGDCQPCEAAITKECYCGTTTKEVTCGSEESLDSFSCQKPCDGFYSCGKHKCTQRCHPRFSDGGCGPCPNSPERIGHCPCGKESIEDLLEGEERTSCEDPIPTCHETCDKLLMCGSETKPHRCKEKCHTGPCPPCTKTTTLVCQCRNGRRTLPCQEYLEFCADGTPFRCERRCKKVRSCGIHRCGEFCCTQTDHICMNVCGKPLSCGQHRCEQLCHVGNCGRCLNASFEEQFCLCGRTMREPPIPCGAPLPECDQTCAREHSCSHPVMHNCHGEETCPPCTFLTSKMCFGGHELRKNIPCHLNQVSCGRPCGKELSCGVHKCDKRCHRGECEEEGQKCTRPCPEPRSSCEHPCQLPCHGKSPCPETECKAPLIVNCECGKRTETSRCAEVAKNVLRIRALREEEESERNGESGGTIRILRRSASMDRLRSLPCDSDCKKTARLRAMADALDIVTDGKGEALNVAPSITYPDFLRQMMKSNPEFLKEVEKTFIDIITKTDETVHGSPVNHHFQPMKLDLRRVIHEYAEYFHIQTESVDYGTKRSVVATAKKGVSRCPLVMLSVFAARFPHALNAPGPVTLSSAKMEAILHPKPAPTGIEPVMQRVGSTSVKSVRRRIPLQLDTGVRAPVAVNNAFAALEDVDDDLDFRSSPSREAHPARDPFDDDDFPVDETTNWASFMDGSTVIAARNRELVEEIEGTLTKLVEDMWSRDDDGPFTAEFPSLTDETVQIVEVCAQRFKTEVEMTENAGSEHQFTVIVTARRGMSMLPECSIYEEELRNRTRPKSVDRGSSENAPHNWDSDEEDTLNEEEVEKEASDQENDLEKEREEMKEDSESELEKEEEKKKDKVEHEADVQEIEMDGFT